MTLEDIEKAIFTASLEQHNLDIKASGKLYASLIQKRDQILDVLVEENLTLQEVGEMWFRISENILSMRIMIREAAGLDISEEVKKMKQLWGSSQ